MYASPHSAEGQACIHGQVGYNAVQLRGRVQVFIFFYFVLFIPNVIQFHFQFLYRIYLLSWRVYPV